MLAHIFRGRLMISYICALRNQDIGGGLKSELFYTDPAEAERFVERWNGTGTGIYDCIGRLRDGTRRRCKEEVIALEQLVIDLDLKNISEPRDAVLDALRSLALPPSEIRDSGNGLHAVWRLKEPVIDAAGLDQAETTMKRLATLLAGDQAPTHRAALLRRPGSDNTKGGFHRPCRVLESTGAIYDIGEFGDLFDLYSDRPLLHYKQPVEAPGDELAAAGAEQPDRAVGLVIDADDAAEPLLAAAAGAILGRELRPELREGDAVLLLEPGIAGGFGAAGGLLGAPFRISGVFVRPEVPAALFASLAEFR